MPIIKSKRKRKKFYKGVRQFERGFNRGYPIAKKALDIALSTKKLLNVEYKLIDIVETSQAVGNSGHLISLNHVGQGDTHQLRNGTSVLNKSLIFKYYITPHASATDTYMRIVLLVDNRPNSTIATISEIFSEARITGHLSSVSAGRFRVLSEFLISVNASSSENTIGKLFKELNFHTKYDGSDSTQNGLMKGQLLLYCISNQATNTPTLHYSTRVRFIDN